MSNGKRITTQSATAEKKAKLAKINEKVELATTGSPRTLRNFLSANNASEKDTHATTANRELQLQIAKKSLPKKRKSTTTATGRETTKRVQFSDTMATAATLTSHKKTAIKKKSSLRTRSNSVAVGSHASNSKQKTASLSGIGGVKRKLKAKKNRAITNVVLPAVELVYKSATLTDAKNVKIERSITRLPLEKALTNAAIHLNLSDEELRVHGGTSLSKMLSLQPYGTFGTNKDLPNVRTISGGEGQKKATERNSQRDSGSNAPSGSSNNNERATKSRPDNSNNNSSTKQEDEDPNKKKNLNKKKDDNKTNNPNANANANANASSSSAATEKAKRKRVTFSN